MKLKRWHFLLFLGASLILHYFVSLFAINLFIAHFHEEIDEVPINLNLLHRPRASNHQPNSSKKNPISKTAKGMELNSPPPINEKINKQINEEINKEEILQENVGEQNNLNYSDSSSEHIKNKRQTAINNYLQNVITLIEKNKIYPKSARFLNQQGEVVIEITIKKNGNIGKIKITKDSPFKQLSLASVEAIKNIKKFPNIPDELNLNELTLKVPLIYKIDPIN